MLSKNSNDAVTAVAAHVTDADGNAVFKCIEIIDDPTLTTLLNNFGEICAIDNAGKISTCDITKNITTEKSIFETTPKITITDPTNVNNSATISRSGTVGNYIYTICSSGTAAAQGEGSDGYFGGSLEY